MASLQISIELIGENESVLNYMFSEKLSALNPETHLVELQYRRAPPGEPLPSEWAYMSSFNTDIKGDHVQVLPLSRENLEGWTWRTRGVVESLGLVSNEVEFVVGKAVSTFNPLILAIPVVGIALVVGYFFFVKK